MLLLLSRLYDRAVELNSRDGKTCLAFVRATEWESSNASHSHDTIDLMERRGLWTRCWIFFTVHIITYNLIYYALYTIDIYIYNYTYYILYNRLCFWVGERLKCWPGFRMRHMRGAGGESHLLGYNLHRSEFLYLLLDIVFAMSLCGFILTRREAGWFWWLQLHP